MSAILVAGYIVGSIVLAVGLARVTIGIVFRLMKPMQ